MIKMKMFLTDSLCLIETHTRHRHSDSDLRYIGLKHFKTIYVAHFSILRFTLRMTLDSEQQQMLNYVKTCWHHNKPLHVFVAPFITLNLVKRHRLWTDFLSTFWMERVITMFKMAWFNICQSTKLNYTSFPLQSTHFTFNNSHFMFHV